MVRRQIVQNKLYKNMVIIGVLFLVVGTSIVSPVIGGKTLGDISVFFQEMENKSLGPDMIEMECHVCKPNNMTTITQMVPLAVAQNLSMQIYSLMSTEDPIEDKGGCMIVNPRLDNVLYEIKNVGLLPDGVTIEELKELILRRKIGNEEIPELAQPNMNQSWNSLCLLVSTGFGSIKVSKGGVLGSLLNMILAGINKGFIDNFAEELNLSEDMVKMLHILTAVLVFFPLIFVLRHLPRFMALYVKSDIGWGKVITSGRNGVQSMEHHFSMTAYGFCGLILTSYFPNLFSMTLGSSLFVTMKSNQETE